MSAATPGAAVARHLRPVPGTGAGTHDAATGWTTTRPALVRLCAGETLLLTDADIDLVDLVNSAADLHERLLPSEGDPDGYRLAEVLVEFLCTRYGLQRHAKKVAACHQHPGRCAAPPRDVSGALEPTIVGGRRDRGG